MSDVRDALADLRFNVLRNSLYHVARRRTLEGRRRFMDFLVLLLGTATAADVVSSVAANTIILGLITAVAGAMQLVWDFGGRARTHEFLQRDYYRLLAEIERVSANDKARIADLSAEMIRIAGDEPPVMKAVDAIAYNDAADALFDHDGDHLVLNWWQRLTKNFLSHDGARFQRRQELKGL